MPKALPVGAVAAQAASGAIDPRLLPWTALHVAAADQCAIAVQRFLGSVPGDVVSDVELCGSYALRTSINACDRPEECHERLVYPVDLMATLNASFCSMDDVDAGKYLALRDRAVSLFSEHIATPAGEDIINVVRVGKGDTKATLVASAVAPVRSVPLLSATKHAMVIRFAVSTVDGASESAAATTAGFVPLQRRPVFVDIIVHVRPDKVGARVSSAKAVAKHPYYANLVLEDHYAIQHLHAAHAAVSHNAELARAIVSAKLWARHIGLLSAPAAELRARAQLKGHLHIHDPAGHSTLAIGATLDCGMSGFVLTSILLEIAKSATAAASTSDALLRQLWVKLADLNSLHHAVDGSHMNLLHVAAAVLEDAAQLAPVRKLATEALSAARGLGGILMSARPTHISEKCDVVLVLRTDDGAFAVTTQSSVPHEPSSNSTAFPDFHEGRAVAFAVHRSLTAALGARVGGLWVSSTSNASRIVVAANLVTEAEGRSRLIRGPPIEDRAAVAAFEALWGPAHTSSRQFADGGVFRCVVWPAICAPDVDPIPANAETSDHRLAATLFKALVQHVVARHHTLSKRVTAHTTAAHAIDVLLEPFPPAPAWVDATGIAGFAARHAVDKVAALVQQSADDALPCHITSVGPVSANTRDTDVLPTLPHASVIKLTPEASLGLHTADLIKRGWVACDSSIDPLHVVAVIDDKRKIPDTVEAIAVMKGAIAAQVAKFIAGKTVGTARVLCGKSWIDVAVDGFVVRVHIAHYREISLLNVLNRTAEAAALERRLFHSTLHHVFIRSVAAQFPSAAGAMRLLKRWIGAMQMSDYLLPEAIELIVAHVYHAGSGVEHRDETPRSAASGFLRALRLLSMGRTFASEPLVVMPDKKDATAATAAFAKAKLENSEQGLFIAAPYLNTESPYTANTPRASLVERIANLAASSLRNFGDAVDAIASGHEAGAPTVVQALFGWLDCRSFDAVLPFTSRVRAVTSRRRPLYAGGEVGSGELSATVVWEATTATPEPELMKMLGGLVERDPASAAMRQMRVAAREDALFFYDAFAPTAACVVMLRKRKQPLPPSWTKAAPFPVCAVPPPSLSGENDSSVPAAIFEVTGVVRKCVEAAAGAVVAPPLARPDKIPSAPAAQQKTTKGKRERPATTDATRANQDNGDATEGSQSVRKQPTAPEAASAPASAATAEPTARIAGNKTATTAKSKAPPARANSKR